MTSSQIFEGIVGVSQLATTIFIGLGVAVAYRQLNAWKDERRFRLRSDSALELMVAAHEVSDRLKSLRSPFDSIPEEKLKDKYYKFNKRLELFHGAAEVFERLRLAQLKASAILGNTEVDQAVDVLFEVRHNTIVAIEMLATRSEVFGDEDPATRSLYERLRMDMWGTSSEKYDPLGMKQLDAMKTIKVELLPVVRSHDL